MIEIGEMIAPAFDLAAGLFQRCCPHVAGPRPAIEKPNECSGGLWRRTKKFGDFVAVDGEVRKSFIGQSAGEAVDPADGLVFAQGPRVEIESVDHLDHHARGKRAAVALQQIEIARRYRQACCHRSLRQPLTLSQTAKDGTGEDSTSAHANALS